MAEPAKKEVESNEGKIRVIPYSVKLDGVLSKYSFKSIRKHETNNYKVIKIISPEEFYLEYIPVVHRTPYTTLDAIYEAMQKFYNVEAHQDAYRITTSIAPQDRMYVRRDPSNQEWHRIRLLQSCVPFGSATGFNLEDFVIVEVEFEDLLELNPDFYSWSKWSIKCHLAGVKPPHGLDYWPAESIEAFKRKCEGQVLHGIASTRKVFIYGTPDNYKHPQLHLGIVLLPKSKTGSITIQREMIDYGYADKVKKSEYDDEYTLAYEYADEALELSSH